MKKKKRKKGKKKKKRKGKGGKEEGTIWGELEGDYRRERLLS